MEISTRHIRGGRWFSAQIELIIKSDNTIITEDIIPWNSDKVDEKFIANLENIIQELKDHNQSVDEYKESISI